MSKRIAFPDTSKAGKVRFFDALVKHKAKIHGSWGRPPMFLVEVPDRYAFAKDCGTPGRPIPMDPHGGARPA